MARIHELSCMHEHKRADECAICMAQFEPIIRELTEKPHVHKWSDAMTLHGPLQVCDVIDKAKGRGSLAIMCSCYDRMDADEIACVLNQEHIAEEMRMSYNRRAMKGDE